jgi:KipI family sensor histidine kinase inhibitor
VHVLAARFAAYHPVPAYGSLLVPFDPEVVDRDELAARLAGEARELVEGPPPARETGRTVSLLVRYGGDDGPDLDDVAIRTGLTPGEVVTLHAGTTYRVFMLGFAPGFAYLGTLPERLALPRRSEPRLRVPPGSVAIAARQTAVYPFATAGGWHLIGRTDAPLWDIGAEQPALIRPGDAVRFVAV